MPLMEDGVGTQRISGQKEERLVKEKIAKDSLIPICLNANPIPGGTSGVYCNIAILFPQQVCGH